MPRRPQPGDTGRNPRERLAVLHRREQVAALYLRGLSQRAIGAKVGVDHATVCRDLKALQAEWLKNGVADLDKRRAVELAKIDELERVYWEGYERSCREREIKTAKKVTGQPNSRDEASKRTEMRDGNPVWLQGVERCIERRCKLLGLDAPQQIDISGGLGLQFGQMTDTELRHEIARLDALADDAPDASTNHDAGPAPASDPPAD